MTRPFVKAGILGLFVILFSAALLMVFPAKTPALPDGFATPIIAFEFARTPEHIAMIFGAADSPERRRLAHAMDLGNTLDYGYMVVYAAFLVLFSITCARLTNRRLFFGPAALAGLALIGDALENIQLLAITARLDSMDVAPQLAALHVLTWLKWGSLALAFLLLVPYFSRGGLFSLTIAAVGGVSFVLAALALVLEGAFCEMFGASTGLMFLLMIIYCFTFKITAREKRKVS